MLVTTISQTYTAMARRTLFRLILTLAIANSITNSFYGSYASQTQSPNSLIIVHKTNDLATFKQSHSNLINILEQLGHAVDIKATDDASLKLSKFGEYLYDNIVMLCPEVDVFRGSVSANDILEFIDSGRNVIVTGSNAPGSVISDLAGEIGFEFKETSAKREYPNIKLNDIYYVIGDKSKFPSQSFSYSGTQVKMLKSDLNMEILTNNAIDDIRPSSNSRFANNVLIGAMQARNNARVVVSGSLDFFSDKAFQSSRQANKHLTTELLKWTFKEKSLLRYSQVSHQKLNVNPEPSTDIAVKTNFEGYTIMDDIEYKIKIEIYQDGQWRPYIGDDVQLEFVRIDPFVRQTMQPRDDGVYIARFKCPDVYGVYKFQVDYDKKGLTRLFSSTQVSVRPLRHNEYERFIYSAYPYYLSAFLMIAYLYIFSFVYLYQQKAKNNNK